MTALGLIETKGLLPAIESADAMLKAADVRLLEKNLAGGGLVTITIAGEVAAVKAAVDAAVSSIQRIKGATLVSEHVIPRPDIELEKVIATKVAPETDKKVLPEPTPEPARAPAGKAETTPEVKEATTEDVEAEAQETQESKIAEPSKDESPHYELIDLKKMNMNELRQVARTFESFSIERSDINAARKKELIEAILSAYKQEKE